MEFNNNLSPAEYERLAILAEEMGEALQCIGKVMRHGYESYNPTVSSSLTNRRELEKELGDVMCAFGMMAAAKDINARSVEQRVVYKAQKIQKYLHYQGDSVGKNINISGD